MNRYALFFLMLVITHTNIIFSNDSVERKNEDFIDKNSVMADSEQHIDKLVFSEQLTDQKQRNAAFALKRECSDKTLKRLDEHDYRYENVKNDVYRQLEACILGFVESQAKNEYVKYTTNWQKRDDTKIRKEIQAFKDILAWQRGIPFRMINEEIKRDIIEEERREACNKIKEGTPGNLTYLFDGSFERRLHKKIDNSFKEYIVILKNVRDAYLHSKRQQKEKEQS